MSSSWRPYLLEKWFMNTTFHGRLCICFYWFYSTGFAWEIKMYKKFCNVWIWEVVITLMNTYECIHYFQYFNILHTFAFLMGTYYWIYPSINMSFNIINQHFGDKSVLECIHAVNIGLDFSLWQNYVLQLYDCIKYRYVHD